MKREKGQPWLSKQANINNNNNQNMRKSAKHKEVPADPIDKTTVNIRGDKWDQAGLRELLAGKHRKLFSGVSKYQDIKAVEVVDIRLYLNEQLQFSTLDERIYHEAFVHIPMALINSRRNVLILGGGDGLALREVLKYSDVNHVDLVDLDDMVLNIFRHVPELAKINDHAFFDKRVHVYAEDALKFISQCKEKYDLIILDFPDPSIELLANLYTVEFFKQVKGVLSDEGMLVCQANALDETPIVFWSIGRTLEAANLYTAAYHTIIPSFGDWGFHLASKESIKTHIRNIHVSHRALPKDLNSVFVINNRLLSFKKKAVINSVEHLVLHKIFQQEVGQI